MISVLSLEHLPSLSQLDRNCFDAPWSSAQLSEELNHLGAVALGYFDGDHLLGAILVRVIIDEIWIFRVMVDPDHRRKGIAHQLLAKVIEPFNGRDAASAFWLEVEKGNDAAIKFYEKEGFKLVTTRRNYYPANHSRLSPQDALIMRRDLKS